MSLISLKLAGWFTMLSACITLPCVYVAYILSSRKDFESALTLTILEASGTALFIIVLICLKRFLNRLLSFGEVNRHIDLFIIMGCITCALSTIPLFRTELKSAIESVTLVVMMVQGGIQFHMGYRLLRAPFHLGGMMRPFCFLTMATGILTASVVLLPLAIVSSALSDLMLATIFMGTAKQLSENA